MRGHLRASAAVVAIAALGAAGPSTATAATTHAFGSSFNLSPAGTPGSVAVDEATGNVYVLNTATGTNVGKILKFSATGTPENFSALGTNMIDTACDANCRQIAVDNSGGPNQGVIYVSAQATGAAAPVGAFLPSGAPVGPITNASDTGTAAKCGVATDAAGGVFVTRSATAIGNTLIDRYRPVGWATAPSHVPPITGTIRPLDFTSGCKTSAGPGSVTYVIPGNAVASAGVLWRFPGTAFGDAGTSTQIDASATSSAVDQSSGDVYAGRTTSVARYDSAGALQETFGGAPQLTNSVGVAVNSATGTVYASNAATGNVSIYPATAVPKVSAATADSPTRTTVELSAQIDAIGAGPIDECKFEYVTAAALQSNGFSALQSTNCDQALPYTGETTEVTAEVTGLVAGTTYRFRVIADAVGATGPTAGGWGSFQTAPAVAVISTEEATNVTHVAADLNGSFTGTGEPTSFYFEWGTTAGYGNQTAPQSIGSPAGPTSVEAPIEGLAPQLPGVTQIYHYRLVVAVDGIGMAHGQDLTLLSTPPPAPGLSAIVADPVTQQSATISAQINPKQAPTVYWIKYGQASPDESATLTSDVIGSDETAHPVSSVLSGLTPGTTYRYRVLATSFGGASSSPTLTFNTPADPGIASTSSSGVGLTSATLGAEVNPGFLPTTYRFEYGLTRSYGASTPETSLGSTGNQPVRVSVPIANLKPGITYNFRVVATNDESSVAGPNQTLTTVRAPRAAQQRPSGTEGSGCRKGFVKRGGKCVRKPLRCRKGFVKKRGKCVKVKAKKRTKKRGSR